MYTLARKKEKLKVIRSKRKIDSRINEDGETNVWSECGSMLSELVQSAPSNYSSDVLLSPLPLLYPLFTTSLFKYGCLTTV